MIPLFKVFMSEDVLEPLNKVLMSGFIGQGPKVEEFELLLKKHFSNHLLSTLNSATSGLHLSLRLLKEPFKDWQGLQDGDEVLATPLTCTATNFPILANNLKIKWVDVDQDTCNMDLDDLARKISPTTKAILPVHWGGYPNDLDRLKQIQEQCFAIHGFRPAIIEDCAHSFGSKYKNEYIGNHGNINVFSFQAIKHFTTGDGGMVIFPHQELYNRSKLLRWYGIDRETNSKDFRCEDDIAEWGYKFHMNDINATIGIHNFPHALECIERHKENSAYYDDQLKDIKGVTSMRKDSWAESACWIHTIKVENRDGFMRHMKECDIMVSRVHERNDKHSCVRDFKSILPNLDILSEEMICIPNGWWVTDENRQYIVDCIKKGW
jgi:dTDP-4-amino-4,6-dideoxy-D-glucose/dTDP-4-amino-2,4-dideoxy-beta-L-xylose transaminase